MLKLLYTIYNNGVFNFVVKWMPLLETINENLNPFPRHSAEYTEYKVYTYTHILG
jgi:hypothetical protein